MNFYDILVAVDRKTARLMAVPPLKRCYTTLQIALRFAIEEWHKVLLSSAFDLAKQKTIIP